MFNVQKRRQRAAQWRDALAEYVYSIRLEIRDWRMGESDESAACEAGFDDSKWKTVNAGASMGAVDRFVWLRNEVTIPEEFAGGEVLLHVDVGREGELFGHTGVLYILSLIHI